MSNSHKELDDWGDDSASLFRDARRAHDPTPAERASFDRVLTRIQPGSAVQPSAATRVGQASSVATVAKFSLVVLGVAAAYFAFESAGRDLSAPPSVAPPQATESAALPPPESADVQPIRTKPSSVQPTREDESATRSAPRRSRVTTVRQRGAVSKHEDAIVAAVAQEQAPSALHNEQTQAETSPQGSASSDDAATPKPARRESSVEPPVQNVQKAAAVAPAEPSPSVPPAPSVTELTLLKRMQAALRAADFTTALALCAEHERRWPHGTFELEREGVHAIAACTLRTDDALPLAKRFLASHPHASLAMRVSSACRKQLKQER